MFYYKVVEIQFMNVLITIFFLFVGIVALKQTIKHSTGEYLNIIYSVYYIFELLVACVLVVLDPQYMKIDVPIIDCLHVFSFGIAIANIGILLGVIMSNMLISSNNNITASNQLHILASNYNINKLSLFLLIGFIFTLASSLNTGYFVAAIALSFSFSPSVIGFLWNRLRFFDKSLWCLILFVNFLFHSMQGSRGTGLFPIVFLLIGYLISIVEFKSIFKKKLLIFTLVAAVSMPIMSFVASFRKDNGRGLDVNMQTFDMMLDYYENYNNNVIIEDDRNDLYSSVGRLLVGANPVVLYKTPDLLPYRGADYIWEEFVSIFSYKGEEGRDETRESRVNMKYGLGVTAMYGFMLTEETSVEWPIFADSYSRFGYFGIFLYSLLFALFLSFIEKKAKLLFSTNPLLSIVITFFLLYNGTLSYMSSYYSFIKIIVFRMTMVVIVAYFISVMTREKCRLD